MNTYITFIFAFVLINEGSCRDFYVGRFKNNDLLVAADRLYKEMVPFRSMYAKYGRIFKCKITYFRIVDRLGYGPGPKTEIVRGGLNHKYLVLRMTSPYNMPISVNIYVGCANTANSTNATKPETTTKENEKDTKGGSETPEGIVPENTDKPLEVTGAATSMTSTVVTEVTTEETEKPKE